MAVRNILYLSPIPYLGGGAELSLLGMVRHLDRERFIPFVALPPGPVTDLTPELEAAGARFTSVGLGRFSGLNPLPWLATGGALRALVRELRIDLIHGNDAGALSYCALASALSGKPAICHFRERIDPSLSQSRLGGWCIQRMKRLIAVSRACTDGLPWDYRLLEKVVVVHNGVDTHHFRPDRMAQRRLRDELHLPPDAILIGIVGQVAPSKGHEDLLAAAPEVLAQCPGVRFVVVGDDRILQRRWGRAYMAELQASIACRSLSDVIHFMGHRRDVAPIVQGLDILAVPSWWEPFGRVVIEGMACGLCVVATRSGGPPEIIDHGRTGLLVPPREPGGLATALIAAARSARLRLSLGTAARQSAVERFSAIRNCQSIMALYDDILGTDAASAG